MDVEAFVLAKAALNGALGTDELETEAKQIKPAINELKELIEGGGGGGSITMEQVLNAIYPVGAIAFGSHPTIGTWEKLEQDGALWLSTTKTAGTTITAGLPNITGNAKIMQYSNTGNGYWNETVTSASGALKAGTTDPNGKFMYYNNSDVLSVDTTNCASLGLDASQNGADPIYGKSTTVQPPAYVVDAWIRTL